MKLVYFAWIREKIGKAEDYIDLPEDVVTVRDLLLFLPKREAAYARALAVPELICVAVDHVHADHDHVILGAQEIALFPPMTGG